MKALADKVEIPVGTVHVIACTIPTDFPESDGTLAWNKTTLVIVQAKAADHVGIGYTYADVATAVFIEDHLIPLVIDKDAMAVTEHWQTMRQAIRNLGRPGVASMAIAAVDNALWDLKARLLEQPLVTLLGQVRDAVPVYGSGGFTSYTPRQLVDQMQRWVADGISSVKMKVGRDPRTDAPRVKAVRDVIGSKAELFVDANGAYSRKSALKMAEAFNDFGVSWFEEPVSSDDLEGLALLRDRAPAGVDIAAGEYGYDAFYFKRMLSSGAVDVLQADVTRCAGITEFLRIAALCDAFSIPLSTHTAPAQHLHVACALPRVRHLEYFHDHVRIENMLFDGVAEPVQGKLHPDVTRPGIGLTLKESDAQLYLVHGNL